MRKHSIIGAAAFVALLITALSTINRPAVQGVYRTDGPVYATLAELTAQSAAVVRGTVVKVGPSYRISYAPAVVYPSTPPTERNGEPVVQSVPFAELDPISVSGLLKTDAVIRVDATLAGAGTGKGDLLTISQLGGVDEKGRSIVNEDDPLNKVGDDSIWFLKRNPEDGRYFATGGGQGRFTISADTVHAVSHDSPVGEQYDGKLLSDLWSAIVAVH